MHGLFLQVGCHSSMTCPSAVNQKLSCTACLADSWNLMTGYGGFFLQTSLIFGWRLPRTFLRCSFTNSWTCLGYVEPPDIFQLVAVVDCVWKDPLNISQETVDRCEPFAPNNWFPPQLGQHEHTILVVCGLWFVPCFWSTPLKFLIHVIGCAAPSAVNSFVARSQQAASQPVERPGNSAQHIRNFWDRSS